MAYKISAKSRIIVKNVFMSRLVLSALPELSVSLTNHPGCGMIAVDKKDQKVRPVEGGKGNQVEVLNDPVTVSGSDISGDHCQRMRRKTPCR